MIHLDLFSGVGGFSLAAERVWPDIEHVFVENDPFCQSVLKKHWPNSEIHGDIKLFTYTQREGYERGLAETGQAPRRNRRPFILTGGFPCQPFSQAGRRKGTEDDRYLWPEMFAVIRDAAPEWVIAENVRGLITWNEGMVLETVCADLEGEGYEVWPVVIPACAVGAPHRRDRVWIIGHAQHHGLDGSENRQGRRTRGDRDPSGSEEDGKPTRPALPRSDAQNTNLNGGRPKETPRSNKRRVQDKDKPTDGNTLRERPFEQNWFEVATRLCTVDDGLSSGLVRPRGWRNAALKACGNAIVPALAIEIFKAIHLTEETQGVTIEK